MQRFAKKQILNFLLMILPLNHFALISVFHTANEISRDAAPFVVVLGVAQDGGVPHAGCARECCRAAWTNPALHRRVSCLAIVDPKTSERWMIDATPDFPAQLHKLNDIAPITSHQILSGIFLTHGHIGHYTGLMHLGREVMGTHEVPVYAMSRMMEFLSTSGPWDQLVRLRNIILQPLQDGVTVKLNERISVQPFLVPHRDEYTETIGFRISGPQRSVIFIPDIDKWEKWTRRIEDVLAEVDRAYLDGTFYADGEVPGRTMSEIPHPFIVESIQRFSTLPAVEKAKVRFIHLNHTNPALHENSEATRRINDAGFHVAKEDEQFEL
jgi:pyrroloquinoline quinone biosynthesis protein B